LLGSAHACLQLWICCCALLYSCVQDLRQVPSGQCLLAVADNHSPPVACYACQELHAREAAEAAAAAQAAAAAEAAAAEEAAPAAEAAAAADAAAAGGGEEGAGGGLPGVWSHLAPLLIRMAQARDIWTQEELGEQVPPLLAPVVVGLLQQASMDPSEVGGYCCLGCWVWSLLLDTLPAQLPASNQWGHSLV
jgi:hypothetical protein